MRVLKNVLACAVFVFFCSSSTCINKNTIDNLIAPSVFIILDTYIATQIELGAEKCFDQIDEMDFTDNESFDKWTVCMKDYNTMEFIISEIRKNIEDNNIQSLKVNLILLENLLEVMGLEVPQEIKDMIKLKY